MRFQFLTFELDTNQRELLNLGVPVAVSPKVFDVLSYLVEHRERMVPKTELLDNFWPSNVTEAALQKTISQIRKAVLSGTPDQPIIKTYHGLGVRFVAPVSQQEEEATEAGAEEIPVPFVLKEQRSVSVLCVHLGANNASEAPKKQDDAATCTYLKTAKNIVEQHQGSLLHMLMDGFTAVFGMMPQSEDSARCAVHCAAALAEEASHAGLGDSCPVFGIDSGQVEVDEDNPAQNWAMPGLIERGATALAEMGRPGDIYLTTATREQLHDEVDTAEADTGFRLISVIRKHAGIPVRAVNKLSAFVGRSVEIAFLDAHLERICNGDGQAVILEGPAGIGKTRLVTEFLDALDRNTYRLAKLQCLPSLRNTPLFLVRELCAELFSRMPEGVVADEIDAALFQELLDEKAIDGSILKGLSEHQRKQRSFALFRKLLCATCKDRPHVVVLEDVHWIDATSREYLEALFKHIDRTRLMLVMTTRPDQSPSFTETVLQLSPLGWGDSLALVNGICESGQIGQKAAETLVQRAGGNPFFVEELALAAQAGGNPTGDLPETVQAVIAARIGTLDPASRNLLYIVAIAGPPAAPELIAHLTNQDPDRVENGMRLLMLQGFIQIEPSGYSFRHMLINDTAYAMVASDERRHQHAEIARYLESGKRPEEARPEELAWHYQQAGQTGQAINYWTAASRAALYRSARHEVITFAENGLALIDGSTEKAARTELDLQLCRASALTALRGFGAKEAGAAYYRAQQLSNQVGTVKTEIRVLVGLWIHTWVRGQLTQSLKHAGKLLELAEKVKDPELSLQAHASAGQVLLHTGDLENALSHLTEGLAAIDGAAPTSMPAQNSAVSCAAYAAWTASMLGRPDEVARFLERSKGLCSTYANPFADAIHYALGAEPFMFLGDVEGCLNYANRAVELSREHDFVFWLATGLVMKSWALSQKGETGEAIAAVDEGIAIFEATGAGVQLSNWYGLKAEVLLAARENELALKAADHALACAKRAEDMYFVPRIHAVCAKLQRISGDEQAAIRHFGQAEKMAAKFGISPKVISIGRPR